MIVSDERLQNLTLSRLLDIGVDRYFRPLIRESSSLCHTCYDKESRFRGLLHSNAPFRRLLQECKGYRSLNPTQIPIDLNNPLWKQLWVIFLRSRNWLYDLFYLLTLHNYVEEVFILKEKWRSFDWPKTVLWIAYRVCLET